MTDADREQGEELIKELRKTPRPGPRDYWMASNANAMSAINEAADWIEGVLRKETP